MRRPYSFLTEATVNDFFKSTIGKFRYLFSGKNAGQCARQLKAKGFKCIYVSPGYKYYDSIFGKSGKIIGSAYYISPNGKQLARISNHWSDSNIIGVKKCGNIRDCYWRLVGRQGSSTNLPYQTGLINLDSLGYTNLDSGQLKNIHPSKINKYFGDKLVTGSVVRPNVPEKELSSKELTKQFIERVKKAHLEWKRKNGI